MKGKARNGKGQGTRDKGQGNGFRPVGNARGLPGRGGKLAAASRRERFRFCSCSASLCLPEELAKKWVIQLVPSSARADQEAFLKEAG